MNPLANNVFLFSLGALLVGMGMLNCKRIRRGLSKFKDWALDNGAIDWIVYGGACWLLVATITYTWNY